MAGIRRTLVTCCIKGQAKGQGNRGKPTFVTRQTGGVNFSHLKVFFARVSSEPYWFFTSLWGCREIFRVTAMIYGVGVSGCERSAEPVGDQLTA